MKTQTLKNTKNVIQNLKIGLQSEKIWAKNNLSLKSVAQHFSDHKWISFALHF